MRLIFRDKIFVVKNYIIEYLEGRELYSEEIGNVSGNFAKKIDLRNLSSRTYLVKIIPNGRQEVKKLVVDQ